MAVKTAIRIARIILFPGALKIIVRVGVAVGGGVRVADEGADDVVRDDDIVRVIVAGAVLDDDIAGRVDLEAAVGERAMVSLDAIVAAGCMDVVAGQSAVVITIIVEDGGVAADEDAVAGILVDDAVFDRRKA